MRFAQATNSQDASLGKLLFNSLSLKDFFYQIALVVNLALEQINFIEKNKVRTIKISEDDQTFNDTKGNVLQ